MDELIQLYEAGAIATYQLALDALHMLDPAAPDLVLAPLPREVHQEILDYAGRYDPHKTHPERRRLPAPDQVEAAAHWVRARQRQSA